MKILACFLEGVTIDIETREWNDVMEYMLEGKRKIHRDLKSWSDLKLHPRRIPRS